jgi:hypothetical protein
MQPRTILVNLSLAALAVLAMPQAHAVPAYARQMNMECGGCHTRFPQLNAFGRAFKLGGYTLTAQPQIEAKNGNNEQELGLPSVSNLGLMFQGSYTAISKSLPDTQNDSVQFPQEMSIFLAGRLAPKLGTFLQFTYDGAEDHFGLDNTEFRYADQTQLAGKEFQYGLTFNNNPTIEDLWNSTPVWGFPWASSSVGPTPGASALIQEGLGQQVAGAGGYALWDSAFYGAATLYRSAQLGNGGAPTIGSENTIDGVAPYWRLAWQHGWDNNYLELGTYGITASLYPTGVSGLTDKYTDVAGDFQYERTLGQDLLTVHGTYIHENRNLDASVDAGSAENASNHLDIYRLDAGYLFGRWQLVGGYFGVKGGKDALLYGPAADNGGLKAEPDSDGFIAQASYYPWKNVQLQTQYTYYTKFNGSSSNYDGNGRDASDNSTLYLLAWLVW